MVNRTDEIFKVELPNVKTQYLPTSSKGLDILPTPEAMNEGQGESTKESLQVKPT